MEYINNRIYTCSAVMWYTAKFKHSVVMLYKASHRVLLTIILYKIITLHINMYIYIYIYVNLEYFIIHVDRVQILKLENKPLL